ncbi:MAG TPA: L,D-transpeptidase family protein [Actinomycetota bacterium]|nr:L,D-transpeptidase family protein [Actinomycetota bacterium]
MSVEVVGRSRHRPIRFSRWLWMPAAAAVAAGSAFAATGQRFVPPAAPGPQAPLVADTPAATHSPTPAPTPARPPVAAVGKAEILEAEKRLSELGYWTGPVDGVMDAGSRHAVMAFQKVEGKPRTGTLKAADVEAMRTASRPAPRVKGARHAEVDLRRQVLFMVDGSGTVEKIVPISSGNGKKFTSQGYTRRAVTPRGRFSVSRKITGWRRSPLGLLHFPSYIVGGIAIHGAPSVPAGPASHGCIRVPMSFSQALSGMLPVGTVVVVHDGGPMVQEQDVASPPGADTPDAAAPATAPPSQEPSARPATPAPSPSPTPRPSPTPQTVPTAPPQPTSSPGP